MLARQVKRRERVGPGWSCYDIDQSLAQLAYHHEMNADRRTEWHRAARQERAKAQLRAEREAEKEREQKQKWKRRAAWIAR